MTEAVVKFSISGVGTQEAGTSKVQTQLTEDQDVDMKNSEQEVAQQKETTISTQSTQVNVAKTTKKKSKTTTALKRKCTSEEVPASKGSKSNTGKKQEAGTKSQKVCEIGTKKCINDTTTGFENTEYPFCWPVETEVKICYLEPWDDQCRGFTKTGKRCRMSRTQADGSFKSMIKRRPFKAGKEMCSHHLFDEREMFACDVYQCVGTTGEGRRCNRRKQMIDTKEQIMVKALFNEGYRYACEDHAKKLLLQNPSNKLFTKEGESVQG